jgi:hypothetical protein
MMNALIQNHDQNRPIDLILDVNVATDEDATENQ